MKDALSLRARKTLALSLIIVYTLSLLLPLSGVANAQESDYELVRGYFTDITFESGEEVEVRLEHPDGAFYNWSYEDEWEGDLEYLRTNGTGYKPNQGWTLSVAIDHNDPLGTWSLVIDDEEYTVEVVEVDESIKKLGDLNFILNPHTEEASDSSSITVRNDGNVLGGYEVIYDNSNLWCKNPEGELKPGQAVNINFTYEKTTEDIELIHLDIELRVYTQNKLDLDEEGNVVIGYDTHLAGTGIVEVGYVGYEREYSSSHSVQYKEKIEAKGNNLTQLTYYIYPNESVDFTVIGENISGISTNIDSDKVLKGEKEEIKLVVEFRTNYIGDGQICLVIDGEKYLTDIDVNPVPKPEEESSFINTQSQKVIGGAAFSVMIIVFLGVRYWKEHR